MDFGRVVILGLAVFAGPFRHGGNHYPMITIERFMVQSGPVQDGIAGEEMEAAFRRQKKSDVSRIKKYYVRGIIISKKGFFF